ncbi:MAG: LysE family translocator [Phycisphaerae bacterium]
MFGTQNLLTFVLAGILLNLTPGPDTMYILARGTARGVKAGVLSALGIGAGSLVHTFAAAMGLSVILWSSATAFLVVKYIGAAYLIYLGISMMRSKVDTGAGRFADENASSGWTIFAQGMLCNVLNPKVAVFFLAFLPQFVDPTAGRTVLPLLLLGFIFITTGTTWCIILGLLGGKVSDVLRRTQALGTALNRVAGAVIIGLGARLALARR